MKRQKNLFVGKPGKPGSIVMKAVYIDAKDVVRITGEQKYALMADRGDPAYCAMANAIKGNSDRFPHPILIPFVTKSSVYIVVGKRKDGIYKAIRYGHNFGSSVDLNDVGYLRKNPALMEREFTLRPPRDRRGLVRSKKYPHKGGDPRTPQAPWGTYKRAIKAGLITSGVAKMLQQGI
jgi:hypothetical protein